MLWALGIIIISIGACRPLFFNLWVVLSAVHGLTILRLISVKSSQVVVKRGSDKQRVI